MFQSFMCMQSLSGIIHYYTLSCVPTQCAVHLNLGWRILVQDAPVVTTVPTPTTTVTTPTTTAPPTEGDSSSLRCVGLCQVIILHIFLTYCNTKQIPALCLTAHPTLSAGCLSRQARPTVTHLVMLTMVDVKKDRYVSSYLHLAYPLDLVPLQLYAQKVRDFNVTVLQLKDTTFI